MDRLIFTSLAAVTEQRVARAALNNELANISTTGFKRSYETALRTIKTVGPGFETRYQPRNVSRDEIVLTPGASIVTGRNLDVSLNDTTVLGVVASDGDLAFTRRGDLRVNAAGVLETGTGNAVMGAGGPLTLPIGLDLSIGADGTVYGADPEDPAAEPVALGRMMLLDASAVRLERREDGLFTPSAADRLEDGSFADGPGVASLASGALEGSNVSAMTAMVKLIDYSRSFELQIKIIKEAKTLDESGASMMRASR